MIHPAQQYADDVIAGRVTVGQLTRWAVERHLRDLEQGKDRGLVFCEESAKRPIDFFHKYLKHFEGEWQGKPITLEPWQQFGLWVQFGWRREEDGTRRFRTAYEEIARKNGKSIKMSGKGLYYLIGDQEPGAQVYTLATKEKQAQIVHEGSIKMVKASLALRQRLGVFRHNVCDTKTQSRYEPLGADSTTQDGWNPHAGLCDEVHAWPNRSLADVIESGMGARRQPIMDYITTAGRGRVSFCYDLNAFIRAILDPANQVEADNVLGIIYAMDVADNWRDEGAWIKANPNLGVSVKPTFLREGLEKARNVPGFENEFKQKYLNMWVEQAVRDMPMDAWDACPCDIRVEDLAGRECWGGLDLAATTDVAALVLTFQIDDRVVWLPDMWVPGHTAGLREQRQRGLYKTWIKAGFMHETEGRAIDYGFIKKRIRELDGMYRIRGIGFDPYNSHSTVMELADEGFGMQSVRQGPATMNMPTKEMLRRVLDGRLVHMNHPVLRWMASNLSCKKDSNDNFAPDKEKSGDKIDGIVAGLIGLNLLMLNGAGSGYDARVARGEPALISI